VSSEEAWLWEDTEGFGTWSRSKPTWPTGGKPIRYVRQDMDDDLVERRLDIYFGRDDAGRPQAKRMLTKAMEELAERDEMIHGLQGQLQAAEQHVKIRGEVIEELQPPKDLVDFNLKMWTRIHSLVVRIKDLEDDLQKLRKEHSAMCREYNLTLP
jgi:hypothetical protein